MPIRLKSRTKSNPYHFKFFQAQTGWESWKASPASEWDFGLLCRELQAHRRANPRFNLPTDMASIEAEVDLACAKGCMSIQGAEIYVIEEYGGSSPAPKLPTPQQRSLVSAAAAKAKKIWAGLKTLNEWYESGEDAVPKEQAETRAKICSECPLNEPGDFEKWFTTPAAEAIRQIISKFSDRNLSTSRDESLHTCRACLCANRLSVHAPIAIKVAHLSEDVFRELKTAPNCWVVQEAKILGKS